MKLKYRGNIPQRNCKYEPSSEIRFNIVNQGTMNWRRVAKRNPVKRPGTYHTH
jgi:hypothetical protein